MRKDWDEGRRTGLLYKPALKSAHSSGFAIDMNVSSLVNSGEVTVDELSDFAKEYGCRLASLLISLRLLVSFAVG